MYEMGKDYRDTVLLLAEIQNIVRATNIAMASESNALS